MWRAATRPVSSSAMTVTARLLSASSCAWAKGGGALSPANLDPYGLSGVDLKPVLRVPVPLAKKASRMRDRERAKVFGPGRMDRFEGERHRPVVQCRRPELNHYFRQTYSTKDKVPLASEHWMGRKSRGDYFTFTAWTSPGHRNAPSGEDGNAPKNFADLGVEERLGASLRSCGFRRPTLIQCLAIPVVSEGGHVLVASETGNGKTVSFLAPALQRADALKREEDERGFLRTTNTPFVLVLAPSRELATQIFNVAQDLAAPLSLNVGLELGGPDVPRRLWSSATRGGASGRRQLDLLVGTPGATERLFRERHYSAASLRAVVLDEADTLLDDTFSPEVVAFLASLGVARAKKGGRTARGSPSSPPPLPPPQLVLCCATMPTSLSPILSDVVDPESIQRVTTNRLHHVLPHVRQTFVRCRVVGKEDYLLHYLLPDLDRGRQSIVFSNKSGTSNYLQMYLTRHGVACESFNKRRTPEQREDALRRFNAGEIQVLSCTDLASRGLDTTNAHHVLNYDFPRNMSDYVHRAGRAGRVGSPQGSKVTSLVDGPISVRLVQQMEEAVRRQREIPNVNSNIIRIIRRRRSRRLGLEEGDLELEDEDGGDQSSS